MADNAEFKGTLPYASELFGVYQPLLGWQASQTRRRAEEDQQRRVGEIIAEAAEDPRIIVVGDGNGGGGPPPGDPEDPGDPLPPWVDTGVARRARAEARRFIAQQGRPPRGGEWQALLSRDKLEAAVRAEIRRHQDDLRADEGGIELDGVVLYRRDRLDAEAIERRGARPVPGTDLLLARAAAPPARRALRREVASAYVIQALAGVAPDALAAVLLADKAADWEIALPFIDPLASFDPATVQAVLSPVGMVHLYRQYFFELHNFLGPPVGHVWIGPGGSVELVEVNTRQTIVERTVEIGRESVERREETSQVQDELSESVKLDNERNIKFGATASGGVNFGVAHGEASASFDIGSTHRTAEETAHKHMRQQSERVSSEIRRNFRTTFRTSTEVTDTSSRRIVVQNTTARLVNYELRRKMRRVAVQVQHIGTQLCWQVFIDEPGAELGVAELVHAAKSGDEDAAPQPPEAPTVLAPKQSDFTVVIPYQTDGTDEDRNELYINGDDGEGERIVWQWDFDAPPPGPGYILAAVNETSVERVDPDEDLPGPVAASYDPLGPTTFRISLNQVNFNDQPSIRFVLQLLWNPPNQAAVDAAYQAKVAEFSEKLSRDAHGKYVEAIRERIKLAGEVAPRPAGDLREEERTVIYRALMRRLMRVEATDQHVTSELVRALFEVDKMLYFVAPEWWRPRRRHRQQVAPAQNGRAALRPLTDADRIGWGGAGEQGRDNYVVTEESRPAPLGASLGWLLQLDGDNHRNAMLNAPWAKAIIPIRPGRELAALNWLQRAEVEGTQGLDAQHAPGTTIRQALGALATALRDANQNIDNVLATETVFETGFNPLAGGVRLNGQPFQVFDEWTEVLPTDQVVALEYDPDDHI